MKKASNMFRCVYCDESFDKKLITQSYGVCICEECSKIIHGMSEESVDARDDYLINC